MAHSQGINALVDGYITDQQNAVVPGAKVVLVSKDTATSSTFISGQSGNFSFGDVVPGTYQLRVTAVGFATYVQDDISVRVGYPVRLDVKLSVGATTQQVEVTGNASALNFENAEVRQSIDPEVIQDVPLLVSSAIRSAVNFATILPGVSSGQGIPTAHISGGQAGTGTLILDGSEAFNSTAVNGIYDAADDFPQSPDVISEFQVLTSNYDPQYSGGVGVVVEHVKSGTDVYHGTLYEFNRNTAFNATQWGASAKPKDIENDFGGNIGGRFKVPWVPRNKLRTYFFANIEGFRITGAYLRSTLSLPSAQERQGNFSDWVDSSGNLIPIYDPATTRANPAYNPSAPVGPTNLPYLRNQFMGCNGNTPNVICSTDPRLQSSLANQWFQYLPTNSSTGPLNNYLAPPVPTFLGTNAFTGLGKVDAYLGSKDHFSTMYYYKDLPSTFATTLPVPISNTGVSYKKTPVVRVQYDHTFNEHVVNHFGFGYQNDAFWGGGIDGNSAGKLPQIPGVYSHAYPPRIAFGNGFTGYGTGSGTASIQPWLAPGYIFNDIIYLTKGKHTLNFGTNFRFATNSYTYLTNQSGTFTFQPTETGLLGINSGSAIASFLLEQVDSASVTYYTSTLIKAKQRAYSLFIGDTWHATPKLSVNPGLRYEIDPPPFDGNNRLAYFDRNLANPGAGNLLGAVAYAGSGPGRSGLRYPEKLWLGGFSPRLGVAYALNQSMVVRAGYGLYYDNTNMPGFDGGITQDGYNTFAVFGSSLGGLQPAFTLSQGVPQTYPVPPQLTPTIDNGLNSPVYRPRDANRLPYSQQWNLTLERQFTPNDYISAAYVGTKGTRLFSQISPLNALNPAYMGSLGPQLYDVFQPGQTTLDGVNAPFTNFPTVMSGCAPSVAQALVAYPQYCNGIFGRDENQGNSTYHAFQLKAEHRFSHGMWVMFNYTWSKLITDADTAENGGPGYSFGGIVSPYQKERYKALDYEDVPQVLNVAYNLQLPFGTGKRWFDRGGLVNTFVGGWAATGIFQAQSGLPLQITSSSCNIPSQLAAICLPGLLPGANPYAQSSSKINVNQPFLNVGAFEPVTDFNFYTGYGRPYQNFRGPGYYNLDTGLQKVFHITERTTFQLRGDAFNVLNSHHLNAVNSNGGGPATAFTTDIASPSFGLWNGIVTSPRNIQVSGRLSF
jgi:hypothetical protein